MPTKRVGTAVFTTLLFFTLSCDKGGTDQPLAPAFEEPQDASISGEVTIEEVGLEGVDVTLSGPESRSFNTDARGAFSFSQLKRGTYTLVLWGFDPAIHSFPTTQQTVVAADGTEVKVEFSGTWVPQPPEQATELQVRASCPETVELNWKDESDDETEFQVERREGVEVDWKWM